MLAVAIRSGSGQLPDDNARCENFDQRIEAKARERDRSSSEGRQENGDGSHDVPAEREILKLQAASEQSCFRRHVHCRSLLGQSDVALHRETDPFRTIITSAQRGSMVPKSLCRKDVYPVYESILARAPRVVDVFDDLVNGIAGLRATDITLARDSGGGARVDNRRRRRPRGSADDAEPPESDASPREQ